MGKIKSIDLSVGQRAGLEKGYQEGKSHAFRKRCQMILLKSEGRSSAQVAGILGGCEVVVNNWLKRYEAEGLSGLRTKAGRGRKPILDAQSDLAQVRQAVQGNRQRIRLAKAELEESLGKSFCDQTLVRFVKKTLDAINESENVPARSHARTSTH